MKPYRIIGIESSPYAVKVRAVMRYRRLPHRWVARMPQFFEETHAVRPLLMPVVQYPDGSYRTDSTTIVRELDAAHPVERSVLPADPAKTFLNDLIEDMADEWLTKSLFHFRFNHAGDARAAAAWVMDDAFPGLSSDELTGRTEDFIARQTSRMPLVGCTPENALLLEAFYAELLDALEGFVATDRFLFGGRPSAADFALYGQLSTLSADPTPGALMRERAPRVWHWTGRMADLSGVEGDWADADSLAPAVEALVALAGRYYLPYLTANAEALDEGREMVAVELAGRRYAQPPFRFHGKCLSILRHAFAALLDGERERLRPLLARTGCLTHLQG